MNYKFNEDILVEEFMDYIDSEDLGNKNETMDMHNMDTTNSITGLQAAIDRAKAIFSHSTLNTANTTTRQVPLPKDFITTPDKYYKEKVKQLEDADDTSISYGTTQFIKARKIKSSLNERKKQTRDKRNLIKIIQKNVTN